MYWMKTLEMDEQKQRLLKNKKKPNRRSIRLKHYDYSQPGLYFITICTQNKENLFGKIENGKMILNDAGTMVNRIWLEIPTIFANTRLHQYIVMPNHFHAIVEITFSTVGAESISALFVKPECQSNLGADIESRADIESAPTVVGVSLPKIVQTFKRYTTIEYIKMVKQNILPRFEKRIWQRNYYEHIIRNEKSYLEIAEYIISNPLKWEDDKYYVPAP